MALDTEIENLKTVKYKLMMFLLVKVFISALINVQAVLVTFWPSSAARVDRMLDLLGSNFIIF